jgi:hypothetical protein
MNADVDGYGFPLLSSVRFDPATGQLTNGFAKTPVWGSFTATWSTLRKQIFIFGGLSLGVAQNTLYTYIPNSTNVDSISAAQVTGDIPPGRNEHCMVEAYGRTKMILFGGYGLEGFALDDIYILDVVSMKWTKGTPGGPMARRRSTSCAATGDYFIVWGGVMFMFKDPDAIVPNENVTLIYNLVTNQWVDTYSPDPYVPPPREPATTTATSPETRSEPNPTGASADISTDSRVDSHLKEIIGGTTSGAVVVGIIVGLFILRRRRQSGKGASNIRGDYCSGDQHGSEHSFQSSTKGTESVDKPAVIDYQQQNRMILQQEQLQQQLHQLQQQLQHPQWLRQQQQRQHPQWRQQQQQQQQQNGHNWDSIRDPQAFIIDSPYGMVATQLDPKAHNWPMYQSATRNLHTPNDQVSASFYSSKRYSDKDTQVFAHIPTPESTFSYR